MISRFEVLNKKISEVTLPIDHEILDFLGFDIESIHESSVIWVEGNINDQSLLGREVFSDEITENIHFQDFPLNKYFEEPPRFVVEVSYLPGVTDNSARAAAQACEIVTGEKVSCLTGKNYYLFGNIDLDQATKLSESFFANTLIQKIQIFDIDSYDSRDRFNDIKLPQVILPEFSLFKTYNLEISDSDLLELSQNNIWALNLSEMKVIQDYYNKDSTKHFRESIGLPVEPTDVEIEILAQTWSEHCKHKIFASNISYSESSEHPKNLGKLHIKSLYKTFIKGATREIEKKNNIDWLISVFSDNAGIVRFSDKVDLTIKVETHNSPSALDPYGGALTGIVGVNRDILGVGLGSKPIANTNVLCFAPFTWPSKEQKDELPLGLHHPKRILNGVHKGIEDGGNKSGIPTVNGAIYFDYNYAGKPLVYCGTIGVMPQKSKTGKSLSGKNHRPGDHIVMIGGRIGVDGIHGATFSSMELDETAPATAVQIGDPLTQRRVTDFMMKARDLELYTSVTDNGAGGLSSSIGEMAEKTNGARIDVALAETKYPGIKPFELIISESQERMSFAVGSDHLQSFLDLANDYNVEASVLGEFTDTGRFEIFYKDDLVGSLEMSFLHEGLPTMELTARFEGEQFKSFKEEDKTSPDLVSSIKKIISCPNVMSKEKWVRQYDHEVQASTLIKPFVGKNQKGPSDSGVIWLYPHGGSEKEAVSISCGLNPRLSYYDTYLMTEYAVDEAVRNSICQGADLDKLVLIDNYCWPDPIAKNSNPDGDHKLAGLVRSCKALYDIATAYGTPFVSGKDSMKNDFIGKMSAGDKVKISVPPTLLVTAMGYIPDTKRLITSSFKEGDDCIALLGEPLGGLKYSEYHRYFQTDQSIPEYIDYKRQTSLYRNISKTLDMNLLNSIHDISDGGLITSIVESMIGGELGAEIMTNYKDMNLTKFFFSERAGRFVISFNMKNKEKLKEIFGSEIIEIGRVLNESFLDIPSEEIKLELFELSSLWRSHVNA